MVVFQAINLSEEPSHFTTVAGKISHITHCKSYIYGLGLNITQEIGSKLKYNYI